MAVISPLLTPWSGGPRSKADRFISIPWSTPEYVFKDEARLGNLRTVLGVPLLHAGVPIGAICTAHHRGAVHRAADRSGAHLRRPGGDRDRERPAARRDAAEGALSELKAAQANLVHAEKMTSSSQLTAGIAHEIKNPLNFVKNFAALSVELLDELKETTASAITELGDKSTPRSPG